MIWLLLSISCSVFNFLLFRQFERWRIDTLLAVASNYISCIFLGWLLQGELPPFGWSTPWLPWAAFIGLLFVMVFVWIGKSAQQLGVNVTTVSAKMSFAIPMMLAFSLYQTELHWQHFLAFGFAIAAILWSSSKEGGSSKVKKAWFLPIAIFLGGGLADASLNYVEVKLLPPTQHGLFLMSLFGTSAIFGWGALGIQHLQGKRQFSWPSFGAGLLLGLTNFLSVFGLLKAFRSEINGAVIFPLLNVGTILLAGIGAWLLFQEQPKAKQWLSLIAAVASILLYSTVA
jgi:drug/metabolite transporter (DMT)-like permease